MEIKIDKMKAKRIAVFIGLKIVEVVGFILAVVLAVILICAICLGVVLAVCMTLDYCGSHPWTWAIIAPAGILLFAWRLDPPFFNEAFKNWCAKNWEWSGKIVGVPEDEKNTPTTE